ncbi:NAD(P)H-dependent oxidoreductase [Streptomyces goshikiensis]|uniref:NAD(P)H-dependent oxidoreductase n=1 Tax=Streptomyces goshikiensis TaxID=1942 RepID=UPI003330EC8E
MVKKRSVIIAGGGIGGLATAVALAGCGIDVTVVERSARVATRGSGLMLYPNGVRAVDALGTQLGARVRTLGHVTRPDEVRVLMDSTGTVLAQEPIGAMGEELGAPQIPLLRSSLQRALLDEALAAGASVMPGTAVEDYTLADDDGVGVLLSDGKTLGCGALVGADGIHSAVRRRMLADGPAHYRGYTSVRGRTKGSALGQRSYVVNGRGIQLFIAPVGGDTLYWTAKITSAAGVWPAKGPVRAQEDLAAALAGWHAPVLNLIRDADPHDIVVTDIHDRDPAPRWVDGRVALLGDAAHPMVPALGQGANMALEDAVVLADAVSAHENLPDALLAYQRERLERTSAVVLKSRRQGALDQGAGQADEERRNARVKAAGRKDTDAADVLGWRPLARRRDRRATPTVVDLPERMREEFAADAPHIVLISGSLRRGSTSDRVADWCAQRCADQGATTRVFNGADIDFPAYRPGLGAGWPDVQEFLDELRRADGVVLVSPTYHGTVSGLLKNAVDYVNDLDGPTPYLEGRAIGCVAVGAGAQGAVSTLATLRTIGHAVRAWPTPVGVAVAEAPAPLPAGEQASTPDGERLVQMVSQVMWMGRVRVAQRPSLLGAVA